MSWFIFSFTLACAVFMGYGAALCFFHRDLLDQDGDQTSFRPASARVVGNHPLRLGGQLAAGAVCMIVIAAIAMAI